MPWPRASSLRLRRANGGEGADVLRCSDLGRRSHRITPHTRNHARPLWTNDLSSNWSARPPSFTPRQPGCYQQALGDLVLNGWSAAGERDPCRPSHPSWLASLQNTPMAWPLGRPTRPRRRIEASTQPVHFGLRAVRPAPQLYSAGSPCPLRPNMWWPCPSVVNLEAKQLRLTRYLAFSYCVIQQDPDLMWLPHPSPSGEPLSLRACGVFAVVKASVPSGTGESACHPDPNYPPPSIRTPGV
ncbi:uncharacterized protein B0H64DRAFT_85284 [Chaetomium fimeti]|uniref:Uncharacterized protein n=1 Tax=Chaetomium fimeti TaxID=1854472 RepID=A0AAE0LVI7_9PEZI|nr:hypothetical protein B0H64DRAFT_85284 [Chaetomium fimeti]